MRKKGCGKDQEIQGEEFRHKCLKENNMSNEIVYQFQIFLRNGSLQDQYSSGSKTTDQSAPLLIRNVQTIGTTVTGDALALGGVTGAGYSVLQNLDASNFVDVGSNVGGTFYPFLRLEAGEQQLIRLAVTTPYAKADTAPVNLFYVVYND